MGTNRMRIAAFAIAILSASTVAQATLLHTAAQQKTIPIQFQGVWDANLQACQSAASDMRLYIEPDRFHFGVDTGGIVLKVTKESHRNITIRAAFNSEGELSENDIGMMLSASGDHLTIPHGERRTTRVLCHKEKSQ